MVAAPGTRVATGQLAGSSLWLQRGGAVVGDTESSIRGQTSASLYPYPHAGFTVEALSDDANDTAAGTGARSVLVMGIRADTLAVAPYSPVQLAVPFYGIERATVVMSPLPFPLAAGTELIWTAQLTNGTGLVGVTSIFELVDV